MEVPDLHIKQGQGYFGAIVVAESSVDVAKDAKDAVRCTLMAHSL